jgi:hypothetical protein
MLGLQAILMVISTAKGHAAMNYLYLFNMLQRRLGWSTEDKLVSWGNFATASLIPMQRNPGFSADAPSEAASAVELARMKERWIVHQGVMSYGQPFALACTALQPGDAPETPRPYMVLAPGSKEADGSILGLTMPIGAAPQPIMFRILPSHPGAITAPGAGTNTFVPHAASMVSRVPSEVLSSSSLDGVEWRSADTVLRKQDAYHRGGMGLVLPVVMGILVLVIVVVFVTHFVEVRRLRRHHHRAMAMLTDRQKSLVPSPSIRSDDLE